MTNATRSLNTLNPDGCRLCGGTESRLLGRNPDFPKSEIFRCLDCGYMWSRPEPTSAELQEVYRATYRSIRQESPTQDYVAFMDARAGGQCEFISGAMARGLAGARVLDIGCGVASLLKVFETHGAAVTGFEPDIVMSGAARRRLSAAAQIENAMFAAEQWHGEPFDLICMSHVLEHVPNPVGFLAGLMKVAKPGAGLFVEVPNETAKTVGTICQYKAQGLMHLGFFNADSLRRATAKAGWTPLQVVTCGENISIWLKTLRRNYSPHWRAVRKLRRAFQKTGLAGTVAPPPTLKKEWFRGQNPNGVYLRMVAKMPAATHS